MSETPGRSDVAARTWPENARPTPQQFVEWFCRQDTSEQERIAGRMLEDAQTAAYCFVAGHDMFPETLRHSTDAVIREICRGNRYRSAWRSARRRAREQVTR